MTGMVRNAALLAVCGVILGASAALAGVPSPSTSVIGGGTANERIDLVGYYNGASDASNAADSAATKAKLQVVVKDLASNVIPGSNVVIDFSGATADVKIAATQSYHGETVGCAGATVSNFTNASGVVNFVVIGGKGAAGAHAAASTKVYADGVLLGSIGTGIYDLTNSGGLTLADLGSWATDYFGTKPDRSDLNGDGAVTLADLGTWATTYFAGKSNTTAAVSCP